MFWIITCDVLVCFSKSSHKYEVMNTNYRLLFGLLIFSKTGQGWQYHGCHNVVSYDKNLSEGLIKGLAGIKQQYITRLVRIMPA